MTIHSARARAERTLSSSSDARWWSRAFRHAVSRPVYDTAAAVMLMLAAVRPWAQPDLHDSVHLRKLGASVDQVLLPVPWILGLVVALGLALALVLRGGPALRAWTSLAVATLLVDVPISLTAGTRGVANEMAVDHSDVALVSRIMGYRLLRPDVTSIGPIGVSAHATAVLSGLRSGYFLCLAAAVLVGLGGLAARQRPISGTRAGRRTMVTTALLICALLADGVELAVHQAANARVARGIQLAETGQCGKAQTVLRAAVQGGTTGVRAAADYGRCREGVAAPDDPFVLLARSREQLSDGFDRSALKLSIEATTVLPTNPILRSEARNQLEAYVLRHRSSGFARTVVPVNVDSAPIRLLLARFDLSDGSFDAAALDASRARALAGDDDLRSAALTLAGIAATDSGDALAGRRLIEEAINADHEDVNVVARSIGAGLYTADLGGALPADTSQDSP